MTRNLIEFADNAKCIVCGRPPTIVRHQTLGVYQPDTDPHYCDLHHGGPNLDEVRVWTQGWEAARRSSKATWRWATQGFSAADSMNNSDLATATLTESEKATISIYLSPCHACRQGTADVESCECQPWTTGIEQVIAERLRAATHPAPVPPTHTTTTEDQ